MSSKEAGAASLSSTKQLLDELDALMEKMLALPVSDGEEATALADDAAARLPKVSATLTILESLPRGDEVDAAAQDVERGLGATAMAGVRLDGPAGLAPPHLDFSGKRAPDGDPQPVEVPAEAVPPSLLDVKVPELTPLPRPARTWGGLIAPPLIAINAIFDLCTFFLGPFGRWLRTAPGRNVLGATGVLLVLVAVGWLIRDWMSWTQ